ncbi:MAG: hypothetical protein ABIF10_04085 [Candidatus Woesearchaeota archaeon]
MKKGLIFRSNKRIQSSKRKCSSFYVYGLSEEDIEQKTHLLEQQVDEKRFIVGIKKMAWDIIAVSDKGLTLAEIMYRLRENKGFEAYNGWDHLGVCIRELFQNRIICRSQFTIPANQMVCGRKPGYLYAKDKKAVCKRIIDLMPREVRKSYLQIINSGEVFPIDILQRKFGIDDDVIKSWFTFRLVALGWVKVYTYKQRRYYYNPLIPVDQVEERVPKIHEESVKNAILENSTLGSAFEKRAIFYFVWYLILKRGRQIRLHKDFPKKISSWFNRDDIRNPEYVELDKNGEPTRKLLVDVWRFDNEPFDYLIFTYDNVLNTPAEGYVVSIKRDMGKKYLGTAGKKYIAAMWGCLSLGMSLDCRPLPKRQLMPVLIVDGISSDKVFKFADRINCEVFYRSRFQKVIDFCKQHGKVYPDDKVLEQLQEEFELLEKYKSHESVLLAKATPEQLVKMKRKYGTQP